MEIIEVKHKSSISENNKAQNAFTHFRQLLAELRTRDLPKVSVDAINSRIESFNALSNNGVDYRRVIVKMQSAIVDQLEKEVGIVPKNYYKHRWLALGMAAFGLPIGSAFGLMMGNIGLMGIGLPIGLAIGAVVGTQKDKKALAEGKQLNVEV